MKFNKLTLGALATLGLASGMVSAQDDDAERKALAERLRPVGELCLASDDCGGAAPAPATVSAGGGGKSGEEIYAGVCMACHDTGAAGAPKRGDEGAWESRLEKGVETLYDHAINGFNAMPAKGGSPSLSDAEVKKAVNYTIEPVYDGDLPDVGGDEGGAQQAASQPAEDQGGATQVAAAGSDIDAAGVYNSACMACHATGAAGAPKREDAEAWAPRLEKGVETLYDHAINGFNAMPAKGGNPALSDAEVKASVNYLIEPVYDGDLPTVGGSGQPASAEQGGQSGDTASAEDAQTNQPATAQADTDQAAQGDGSEQQGSASSQAGAQEVAASSDLPGADKIGTCVACHGQDGHGTAPMYPKLAGQNATYMENALKAYRAGERQGGMSSVMTPMASSLSDEDIKDIAEYYSQQTP